MSLDENEFFDVYRQFFPNATRAEFAEEWAKFQQFKAEYLAKRSVN